MSSPKQQTHILSDPKRILLPRFDTLGDIVLLEGFLESLQKLSPEAQLVFLVRKGYEALSPLFPRTIEWMTTAIDPLSALPDALQCKKLVQELTSGEGEMLLATSYNRTWADDLVAARLSGARRIALGEPLEIPSLYQDLFTQHGLSLDCPYDQFVPVDETHHETEKYEILFKALGGKSKLPEPRLSVPEKHQKAARRILDEAGLKAKNFCLCFPAGTQQVSIKAWSPERFAEVISWMEKEYQLPSLVAAHQSEVDCVEAVVQLANKSKAKPSIWLGKDGEIPVLAALSADAKMFVGNDTGPMHIAAVKTPVVAIFGGGTWPRFRPRGDRSTAIAGKMPCFGCGWNCIFTDAPCMSLVAVQDVQKAIVSLYDGSGPKRKGNKVIAASTRLDETTQRYIKKAVETHRQIEADRVVRLRDNQRLEQMLRESEEDRAVRLKANQQLVQELKESEADRAARLENNQKLELLLKESEADRAVRLEIIHELESRLKGSEESEVRVRTNLEALKESKLVRFLIRLGLVSHGEKLNQPKEDTGEEES